MVQRGVNLGYSDISEINIDLDGLSHCCCALFVGGGNCRVQRIHQAEAFEATISTGCYIWQAHTSHGLWIAELDSGCDVVSVKMTLRWSPSLLFLLLTAVTAGGMTIPLRAASASFSSEVYKSWIPSFTQYRDKFIKVEISYGSVGSGTGKTWIQDADAHRMAYAGSDSIVEKSDYELHPDLRMFPVIAGQGKWINDGEDCIITLSLCFCSHEFVFVKGWWGCHYYKVL